MLNSINCSLSSPERGSQRIRCPVPGFVVGARRTPTVEKKVVSDFIHSFIHYIHLYSASSGGTTQKRSKPQRCRICCFKLLKEFQGEYSRKLPERFQRRNVYIFQFLG